MRRKFGGFCPPDVDMRTYSSLLQFLPCEIAMNFLACIVRVKAAWLLPGNSLLCLEAAVSFKLEQGWVGSRHPRGVGPPTGAELSSPEAWPLSSSSSAHAAKKGWTGRWTADLSFNNFGASLVASQR